MAHDPTRLLRRLNAYCTQALTAAASLCQARGHSHISIEHWLLKLFEQGEGDLVVIARRHGWDMEAMWQGLLQYFDTLPRSVLSKPQLSTQVQQLISSAWLLASMDRDCDQLRSVHLLAALVETPDLLKCSAAWPLLSLGATQLQQVGALLERDSEESQPVQSVVFNPAVGRTIKPTTHSDDDVAQPAILDQYSHDVTAKAAAGQIDPVFGRDNEIRQVIDVLSRRRKNNPILVGEPGVGKTALVEGLALRIVSGDVPDSMKPVSIRTLDLGLLQAGAGVKGEFEQRLKRVIEAVQQSETPILLFIDEAHTLIGAGNQAGAPTPLTC